MFNKPYKERDYRWISLLIDERSDIDLRVGGGREALADFIYLCLIHV